MLEFIFLLLCAAWELVVWAFFGGAITRMAAVALARDEQLSWGQLTGYARSKWSHYFSAPIFPLFGVLLATMPLAILGLLLRIEAGLLVGGILWFLVLLGGLFMAILAVGLYFGWPLMWATISVEGTDAFDALSRSYAYTYQRPLHYLFYSVVAGFLGVLGWVAVAIFVSATIAPGHLGREFGPREPAFRPTRWPTTAGRRCWARPAPRCPAAIRPRWGRWAKPA